LSLKYGSSGNAVKEVQTMLKGLGINIGPAGADGKIGPYSDSAIKKFQIDNGLLVDGVVGPKTLAKLTEKYKNITNPKPAIDNKPVVIDTPKISAPSLSPTPKLSSFLDSAGAVQNLITIVNCTFNPPRSINFYGITPDEVTESHSASFDPQDIRGRSNPLAAYSGSGARTTSLSIDVHEDYLRMYSKSLEKARLVDFIGQIKALTYPRYQSGIVIAPKVFIKIGEFFLMKAYCSQVSVTWKKPLRENKYYVSANISMDFSEILSISFSADEVATGMDLGRYIDWPG